MDNLYYTRDLEARLQRALQQFPVVLVTGARQAGKSTLLSHTLKGYTYVTLDDPVVRDLARRDPKLFLQQYATPLIIDEIQYAPDLLSYVKMVVDADRRTAGQYVLTGSQIFQLMSGVSESLAGRVAILQLYPFSWSEISHIPSHAKAAYDDSAMMEQMLRGFYPEFFALPNLDWAEWYNAYISTYLERDVRNIKAVKDLSLFQTFLELLATRAGSLLNLSELGKECGITQPTAKNWLTLLESTYIIYLLRPFHNNRSKRLVKSPKLFFVDTGLLSYLLGIETPKRLLRASERGAIFENMVIMEQIKRASVLGKRTNFFFYRTKAGVEVDLVIQGGEQLEAYEIKFSKTPSHKMGDGLKRFVAEHPDTKASLLCLTDTPLPITSSIQAIHWNLEGSDPSLKTFGSGRK